MPTENLLTNGNFGGDWWRKTHDGQEYGNIFVPFGWTAYWLKQKEVPHDPANLIGYSQPEMKVIKEEPPFLDPPRIRPEGSDGQAVQAFSFYRIHKCGYYQKVPAVSGRYYRAGGFAHAWSSTDDIANTSNGVGSEAFFSLAAELTGSDDGRRNMMFRVGIDPAGGEDPFADSVVWGNTVHIYNAYQAMPEQLIQAEGDHVTVFLESEVLWPFKHCDAYFDDSYLYDVTDEELPTEPDYMAIYHLLPQIGTLEQAMEAVGLVYPVRGTMGFSPHDAGRIERDNTGHVIVYQWAEDQFERDVLLAWLAETYGVTSVTWLWRGRRSSFPIGSRKYPPEKWYAYQQFTASHPGVDLNLDVHPWGDVERGEPVLAILDGTVHYATENWGGVGMCVISHPYDGKRLYARYAHIDLTVSDGEEVKAGDIIGHIGNWTGGDGGDHLHLDMAFEPYTREWLVDGPMYIDPVPLLKSILDPDIVDEMLKKDEVQALPPQFSNYTNNLLGLHRCFPAPGWDQYVVQGRPNLDKAFHISDVVQARKLRPDDIYTIWRRYYDQARQGELLSPDLSTDEGHRQMFENASWLVSEYENELRAYAQNEMEGDYNGLLDLIAGTGIESLNEEYAGGNPAHNYQIITFDTYFCDIVATRFGGKLVPVVFTAAVGNVEPSDFEDLVGLAKACENANGFMGYHGYWTATKEQPFLVEHWPYHAGRWQEMDKVFTEYGIYVRWMLGEVGIVASACPDGTCFVPTGGYQDTVGWPMYFDTLKQFNDLLLAWNRQNGNRCVGSAIFAKDCNGWEGFNLASQHLIQLTAWGINVQ